MLCCFFCSNAKHIWAPTKSKPCFLYTRFHALLHAQRHYTSKIFFSPISTVCFLLTESLHQCKITCIYKINLLNLSPSSILTQFSPFLYGNISRKESLYLLPPQLPKPLLLLCPRAQSSAFMLFYHHKLLCQSHLTFLF